MSEWRSSGRGGVGGVRCDGPQEGFRSRGFLKCKLFAVGGLQAQDSRECQGKFNVAVIKPRADMLKDFPFLGKFA